ncbi:MAG: glycosyltransferase [Acetobacteraceae bacterium]
MRTIPDTAAMLSLSTGAEILRSRVPPACELPFDTYDNSLGFLRRLVQAPLIIHRLARRLRALRPEVGICALPALLDLLMMAALRRNHAPMLVVVHDADLHPGDGRPLQMFLQRRLMRRADAVIALSHHVAERLREQRLVASDRLCVLFLPPFVFGPQPPPPLAHGGALRLLFFGRLLRYKGLDLLADAVRALNTRSPWVLRVVGSGPECEDLAALRAVRASRWRTAGCRRMRSAN